MEKGGKQHERDQAEYRYWRRGDQNAIGNDRYGRSLPEPRVDEITVQPKEKKDGKR
jgi:hypothetical protein